VGVLQNYEGPRAYIIFFLLVVDMTLNFCDTT
jgi:hypothetical protein